MRGRGIGRAMAAAGLAALLVGVAGSGDDAAAWSRGRGGFRHGGFHGHGGVHGPRFFGARVYSYPYPYYYPYYGYPYPPYYAYPSYPYGYVPPPAVEPPPAAAVAPPAPSYWYYCTDPPGYYPTVAQCPGGWIQVPPRSEP